MADVLYREFRSQDQHLCHQCRVLSLQRTLTHSPPPPYSGATLVAHRTGLDPQCSLCNLFSTTIFPVAYAQTPKPNSTTPWKLRSLNMHLASVPPQISQLFPCLQLCILHAGDGDRDYYKHINDEETERRGYLAYARTKDLVEFMAQRSGGSTSGMPEGFINLGQITVFTTSYFVEQDRFSLESMFARLKEAFYTIWILSDGWYGEVDSVEERLWDRRSDECLLEPIMV